MKDAYYFSHDSNAKDDPKCVLLIEQLGLEGYGIYWVLIETLRDQPEYKYPLALVPAIARRYNTTAEKMKTVVGNYGLFEVDADDFFSLSLIKRMELREEERLKRSIAGQKGNSIRWSIAERSQCDNNAIGTQSQSIARKGKERKEKGKENKEKNTGVSDFFESIWKLYPKKEGKGSVSKTQKEKLFKIGYDEISRAIDRYKKQRETKIANGEWCPELKNGSTFFNSGYVDYLDKNYQEPADPPISGRLGIQMSLDSELGVRRDDM